MSLVSSDSEGEQNELRNLQEKLESTMKLVTNLSGQLSELKDQVRETWLRTGGHALLRAGQRSCKPVVQSDVLQLHGSCKRREDLLLK